MSLTQRSGFFFFARARTFVDYYLLWFVLLLLLLLLRDIICTTIHGKLLFTAINNLLSLFVSAFFFLFLLLYFLYLYSIVLLLLLSYEFDSFRFVSDAICMRTLREYVIFLLFIGCYLENSPLHFFYRNKLADHPTEYQKYYIYICIFIIFSMQFNCAPFFLSFTRDLVKCFSD